MVSLKVNKDTVDWIVKNAKTSMYDAKIDLTYIIKLYFNEFLKDVKKVSNKAAKEYKDYMELLADRVTLTNGVIKMGKILTKTKMQKIGMERNRFQLIRDGLVKEVYTLKEILKLSSANLMEEAGELGRAILKNDDEEFVDAIGDMVVVLTNLAHLGGTTIEECIDSAYNEIKDRKGGMKNGTFVKD